MLYFAYGSNMSPRIMAQTCDDYTCVGIARLDDYRLAFNRKSERWGHGVADVVASPGSHVWGVLYELGAGCLAALDIKEGVGVAYDRQQVQLTRPDSDPVMAMTYMVISKLPKDISPSPNYIETILEGALANRLPEAYLAFLRTIQPAR